LVLVDENGNPLRKSIIWCDSRAVEIGNEAFKELGLKSVLSKNFRVITTVSNYSFSVAQNVLIGNVYKQTNWRKMGFKYYLYKSS
jgi:hypothetical protein